MHIAFVTPEYPCKQFNGNLGGIGTFTKNLAEQLVANHCKVTVFIYGQPIEQVLQENKVTIHFVKRKIVKGFTWYTNRKYFNNYINKIVAKERIDVLEAPEWGGVTAFMKFDIPLVIRLHGSDTYFCHLEKRTLKWKNKFFEKNALIGADKIIGVSEFVAKKTKKLFKLELDIDIIYNTVDTEKFKPNHQKIQLKSLLYFGTLVRKKGVLEIAKVFSMLVEQDDEVRLVLVGKDNRDVHTGMSTLAMIKEILSEKALKRMTYIEAVPYDEVISYIQKADVVLLPSLAEAFPMSWLEAMAMEKKLITSNIGWAKELMVDGETGCMVNPSNHQDFFEKIKFMLDNEKEAKLMANNARKRIQENFSSTNSVVNDLILYKSLKNKMKLNKYTTSQGEKLLYVGNPNKELLEELSLGEGDLWHSSFEQGFKNCFQDLRYQTSVYWWFINDFDNLDKCISWRVNPYAFVVRESVWNTLGGFDTSYASMIMSGLDFGYNLLRNSSGIPIYVQGLFEYNNEVKINISSKDRYLFFFKNFKNHHAYYMMLRKGIFRFPFEILALFKAKRTAKKRTLILLKPRKLQSIKGKPTVSLVIPTMRRQAYSQLLLEDHKEQTYLIKEAVIVDATPKEDRDDKYYRNEDFPFDVKVKWQTTIGSCRARNEGIDLCSGDYIIFADDDVRILPEFVENHIRLLQTYNVPACNGLDIMAENIHQNHIDLIQRVEKIENNRWKVGVSKMFSNANSCVRKDYVNKLIGNDVNFDGGYGEDADFGLSIIKSGGTLLHNPFSPNLHLKPPQGGYRWWGIQAKKKGKRRKQQPWELDNPVKYVRPIPSPTVTYGILKHFTKKQIREWRVKHFFIFLFKNDLKTFPIRVFQLPYKQFQFTKSLRYAKALINLGIRYK